MAELPGVHGYYRYPALHGDALLFAAENDLWEASVAEGAPPLASRLTSAAGRSLHPAVSPDGRWVAFASNRGGGGDDVWVMPFGGGRAERLTYEAVPTPPQIWEGLRVSGWNREGTAVLYATPSFSELSDPQLVLVTAFGERRGECTVLGLAQASGGVLVRLAGDSADTLFFERLPFQARPLPAGPPTRRPSASPHLTRA